MGFSQSKRLGEEGGKMAISNQMMMKLDMDILWVKSFRIVKNFDDVKYHFNVMTSSSF